MESNPPLSTTADDSATALPVFRLSHAIFSAILAHCRAELPNEAVGLLAGISTPAAETVTLVLPLRNELRSPSEFRSEPRDMLRAMRRIRDDALRLLAVYHSHPTSPPEPSRKDHAAHLGPEFAAVIVSFADAEPSLAVWYLADGQATRRRCELLNADRMGGW